MLLETFKKDIKEGSQINCELCVIARAYARKPMPAGSAPVHPKVRQEQEAGQPHGV